MPPGRSQAVSQRAINVISKTASFCFTINTDQWENGSTVCRQGGLRKWYLMCGAAGAKFSPLVHALASIVTQPFNCPLDNMSFLTYFSIRDTNDKVVVWQHGEVKSPPFSAKARMEAGLLLRRLQMGEPVGMPHSRPMATIGKRCHELRITDSDVIWRIIYRIDTDAIVILEVFAKKTSKTPKHIIDICKDRLRKYDHETS